MIKFFSVIKFGIKRYHLSPLIPFIIPVPPDEQQRADDHGDVDGGEDVKEGHMVVV
jgi:hypothetical protein